MNNPFEIIEARLNNIENLILDLKHHPKVEPTDQPDQLLTIQEAVDLSSLSPAALYSKVNKGELPVKRSNSLFFFRIDVNGVPQKRFAEIEDERYLILKSGSKKT